LPRNLYVYLSFQTSSIYDLLYSWFFDGDEEMKKREKWGRWCRVVFTLRFF
jgi:hypothetical protein